MTADAHTLDAWRSRALNDEAALEERWTEILDMRSLRDRLIASLDEAKAERDALRAFRDGVLALCVRLEANPYGSWSNGGRAADLRALAAEHGVAKP